MRLIDADALKERAIRVSTVKEHCYLKAVGTHEIDKATTVDAIPVVRCKDCEWFNTVNCAYGFGWCDHFDIGMFENDFCSHGAKKEHPEITEQTMDALNKMGAAVHGGIK